MKTWAVIIFAVSNTAIYFWSRVDNIPAMNEQEANQKAVLHAMTRGLNILVESGAQAVSVKPVFAIPFITEEQKKVEIFTQLPPPTKIGDN